MKYYGSNYNLFDIVINKRFDCKDLSFILCRLTELYKQSYIHHEKKWSLNDKNVLNNNITVLISFRHMNTNSPIRA